MMLDSPPPSETPLSRAHKRRLHLKRLGNEHILFPLRQIQRWYAGYAHKKRRRDHDSRTLGQKLGQVFTEAARRHTSKPRDGKTTLFRPALDRLWEIEPASGSPPRTDTSSPTTAGVGFCPTST